MPPKNPIITKIRIEAPDGYIDSDGVRPVDITPEPEQDRLNRMAVEYIRNVLPDNMELVSRLDDDGK